jgi:hypothetical protein
MRLGRDTRTVEFERVANEVLKHLEVILNLVENLKVAPDVLPCTQLKRKKQQEPHHESRD